MTQMNLSLKQKQIHRHKKQTYGYQRGWKRISLVFSAFLMLKLLMFPGAQAVVPSI